MKNFLFIFICVLINFGKLHAQCAQIDSLYRVLRVAKAEKDKINTLNQLAEELSAIGKDGQAAFYAKQSLKMAEKIEYSRGIADAMTHIAQMDYADMRDIKKNIEDFQQALEIYKDLHDKAKTIQTLEIIGSYYYKLLDTESHRKAIIYYAEVLSLYEKQEDKEKIAHTQEILGTLYASIEDDQNALEAYKAAIDIRKELGIHQATDARIWMKYNRISLIEQRLKNTNVFALIIGFGILTAVFLVIIGYLLIQKNRAQKNLEMLMQKVKVVK